MLNPYNQSSYDHDLTELSWLTRSNIFDRSSSVSSTRRARPTSMVSQSFPIYPIEQPSPPGSLLDSSDSEHDIDSSSLNSSSERVTHSSTEIVSPPHSALCFWILFAIEESPTHALTLNEICDWIEHYIEQQSDFQHLHPIASDEQFIHSTRLKSKVRYHMTKQISFFMKIIHDPLNGIKLRYPLWTIDRSKRALLLDTLLTMNARQLSLYTQYTIEIFERLCTERRRVLSTVRQQMNDENSCPTDFEITNIKRDKTIHRLGSADESSSTPTVTTTLTTSTTTTTMNPKRKKQRSKVESKPSVEVVDAALTLLLLRQPR